MPHVGTRFDCVMPAAGASSRMGRWKPLLPWAGRFLVEAAVEAALSACSRVLLVAGYRASELASLFHGESRVLVLDNPAWERGMLGSIQRALPEVRGAAFFCANADMPFVRPADYEALAAALAPPLEAEQSGCEAFAASAFAAGRDGGGRLVPGHPVLVPATWIPDILALSPASRMKPFLLSRPFVLVERGQAALFDVDSPDDYEAALRALGPESAVNR